MELQLRQLCLAAVDKSKAVELMRTVFDTGPVHGSGDLSAYGLPKHGPMSEGGHALLAAQGIENLLFPVGSDFIEILFTTSSDSSVARYLQRSGGPGVGYMVILQDDDVNQYADNADAAGVRVVYRASYPAYVDVHFHPKDTGGALLAVASHLPENVPGGAWYPAGSAWEQLPPSARVSAIVGARMHSAAPEPLARRWGKLLGRDVAADGDGWRIELGDAVLRFADLKEGAGESFSGIDLRTLDREGTLAAARDAGLEVTDGVIRCLGLSWRLVS